MLDKLRRNLREIGATATAVYALDRVLAATSGGRAHAYRYLIVAQPIGEGVASMRPDAKASIEAASPGHPLVAQFPRPAPIIAQRFAAGANCLVARNRGGGFAGYLWWQRGHYDEDEVRCRFVLADPASSVWDFDVYVEPEFRLGRTMARLWDAAARQWHADGVRWSFSRISAFNAASIAAHGRMGTRSLGTATFVVIGRWQLTVFGKRPWVHVSVGPGTAPTLRLDPPR